MQADMVFFFPTVNCEICSSIARREMVGVGAAMTQQCVSYNWGLHAKLNNSLPLSNTPNAAFKTLSFSSNTSSSLNLFSRGLASMRRVKKKKSPKQRRSTVSPVKKSTTPNRRSTAREKEEKEEEKKKKPDSAAKRARQSGKRRVYNRARKSEVRTRMKKVLEALDLLVKKTDAEPEEVVCIEKLIAEAYSVIDKAVKVGTLHRKTGVRRKSRLARSKKAVEIHYGWYKPASSTTLTA